MGQGLIWSDADPCEVIRIRAEPCGSVWSRAELCGRADHVGLIRDGI